MISGCGKYLRPPSPCATKLDKNFASGPSESDLSGQPAGLGAGGWARHTGHADDPVDGVDENDTAGGKNGRCNAGYELVFPGG